MNLLSFSAWQLWINSIAIKTIDYIALETRLIQSCQALKLRNFICDIFAHISTSIRRFRKNPQHINFFSINGYLSEWSWLRIWTAVPLHKSKSLIIKANLSWSRTRVKFCQFTASLSVFISFFFAVKVRLKDLKFELCQFKLEYNHSTITNKLAINWQNFARVRLQLKFAFIMRLLDFCVCNSLVI